MESRMIYTHNLNEQKVIEKALEYLPPEKLATWENTVAICTNDGRHGIRIFEEIRKEKELIFLSERIWPPKDSDETNPFYRFFIFTILHEFAHIDLNDDDDDRANERAKEWFNLHVEKINQHPDTVVKLPPMTCKERMGIKDIVDGRDWSYNSSLEDLSGTISITFITQAELAKVLKYFDKKGECAEVIIRRFLREILEQEE